MRVSVNFASREYLLVRRTYAAIVAGILVMAALLLAQYSSYSESSRKVEDARKRYTEVSHEREALLLRYKEVSKSMTPSVIDATTREAEFANQVISGKSFSWTLFLNRFEELVPNGVGIQSISPNFESLAVSISGTARDMPTLIDFIDNLTASEYFEDLPPSFKSSQTVVDKDTGKKAEAFSLSIKYFPEGRAGGGK